MPQSLSLAFSGSACSLAEPMSAVILRALSRHLGARVAFRLVPSDAELVSFLLARRADIVLAGDAAACSLSMRALAEPAGRLGEGVVLVALRGATSLARVRSALLELARIGV